MSKGLGAHFKNVAILTTALTALTPSFGFAQGDARKTADVGSDSSSKVTRDEFFFGDYNRATPITEDEAVDKSIEENSIVLIFTKDMSPAAVMDTYDFFKVRRYSVSLHSGLEPDPDIPDTGQIFAWVGGFPAGPFVAGQIDTTRAFGDIKEAADDAGVLPQKALLASNSSLTKDI